MTDDERGNKVPCYNSLILLAFSWYEKETNHPMTQNGTRCDDDGIFIYFPHTMKVCYYPCDCIFPRDHYTFVGTNFSTLEIICHRSWKLKTIEIWWNGCLAVSVGAWLGKPHVVLNNSCLKFLGKSRIPPLGICSNKH